MGKKEVDASFIDYCKEHNFSAHKVATIMKKRGFSEDQVFDVYKKLYSGEKIRKRRYHRALHKAARDVIDHRGAETKRMLMMIQNNQYYLTLFAFMVMGFLFSTLYVLTVHMPDIIGVFIIFGVGYLNGILLYNVFRMFNVSFKRQLFAAIFAPFIGLAFIAAAGYFFATIRDIVLEQYATLGTSAVKSGIVLAYFSPLNTIFAMILFYVGYNFHTFVRLSEHKPQRDFSTYLLAIPLFLFSLILGWGIYRFFLEQLIIRNIFG